MQRVMMMAVLIIGLFFTGQAQAQTNKLITWASAGEVKVGMTVAEVRDYVKPMILSRTSDGEGVALIAVKDGENQVMTLYANEEDPKAAINENAKISNIEVWDKSYKTEEGVYVGMSLSDTEMKYGKVTEIIRSEIEAREFATFTNHPSGGLSFRLMGENDGSAGKYAEGKRTTSDYASGAFIYSIQVVGPRFEMDSADCLANIFRIPSRGRKSSC